MTDEQIDNLIEAMENNAVPAPVEEFTMRNWLRLFGEDGFVETPIGRVKMGENQFAKLYNKERENEFGMVKPTLLKPDIVLIERDFNKNVERNTKLLFIKTFISDKEKTKHFENVTISKEGNEIVISCHLLRENQLPQKMKNDDVAYIATALNIFGQTFAESNIVHANPETASDNKDNTNSEKKQKDMQTKRHYRHHFFITLLILFSMVLTDANVEAQNIRTEYLEFSPSLMQAYNDLTATITYQNYLFGFEQPPAYYYVSCASPIRFNINKDKDKQEMFVGGVVSAKTYGVTMELIANLNYAYSFKAHEKITLVFGVSGGVDYRQHDFSRLYNDYFFDNNPTGNYTFYDDDNRKETRFAGKASVNILLLEQLHIGGYTTIDGRWDWGANIEWHKKLEKKDDGYNSYYEDIKPSNNSITIGFRTQQYNKAKEMTYYSLFFEQQGKYIGWGLQGSYPWRGAAMININISTFTLGYVYGMSFTNIGVAKTLPTHEIRLQYIFRKKESNQ